MIIRCKQCHGSVPFQRGADWGSEVTTTCPTCDQRYVLKNGEKLHEKLYAKACETARKQEIDLPGAFSVLLGIMDVEEVRALHGQPATIVTPDENPDYDPAFKESVEAGRMTAWEAMERGQRDALAGKIADRHGLSTEAAQAVADKRTSLLAAIRAQKTARTTPVQIERSPRSRALLYGMSAVVVTALVGMWFSGFFDVKEAQAGSQVKIHTDDRGQTLQIEGPDAMSVLDAYCGSGQRVDRYECVGLRQAPRDGESVKLGVFRKHVEPELEYAIYISRDRGGKNWLAGNGRSPLAAFLAPDDLSDSGEAASTEP